MKKFFLHSNQHKLRGISTASIPDVVFMLLFFFMVTTIMRESEVNVKHNLPVADQVKRLEDKSLVNYVYIGEPKDRVKLGQLPRIQINDAFVELSQVGEHIAAAIEPIVESKKNKSTVSLKVDDNTEMGIVTDVKQELRKVNALKICYSARQGQAIKKEAY